MKVGGVFISVVLMFSRCNSIAVSSIDCGDICAAITGSSYTLTCRWNGALQTGIVWKRKGTEVVICNTAPDGDCIPPTPGYANGSYVNSQTADIKITNFGTADIGNWECSDGLDTSKSCTLTPIAPRNIILEASCTRVEKGHTVTCKLDDHGTPAITLEMRDDNVMDSTTTAGQLSKTISGAGMKTYTCAVTGQGSECATPKLKTTTCDADGDMGLPIGVIVVIIILVAIVIVLLVLMKNGMMENRITVCVFDAIVIIIAVVFIILLFVLHNDYADGLFIAAVVIVIVGVIVSILAVIILHV